MTSIKLGKLDDLYRKIVQTDQTLKMTNDFIHEIAEEFGLSIQTYWTHGDDVKTLIVQYIVKAYQQEICPNFDLYEFLYEDLTLNFLQPNTGLNCHEVVTFINNAIGDSTERHTYIQLRRNARAAVDRHWNDTDYGRHDYSWFISNHTAKNTQIILRLSASGEFLSHDELEDFEIFCNLILFNKGLFNRVPPSQIKDCAFADYIKRRELRVPNELKANDVTMIKGKKTAIKSMVFYRNGRVNICFANTGDMIDVAKALSGEEPKIYFPKSCVKAEDIFDQPSGRSKRIVKVGVCSDGTTSETS